MVKIEKNGTLIIRFSGRLDATNSAEAGEIVAKELEGLDKDIILDVSELEYISSAGLQVVLACAKAAKSAGKETYLEGAKGNVLEIFRLSGFLTFLKEK